MNITLTSFSIILICYSADAKHTKLLLLLDSSLNVHVFPRTSEATEIVSKASSSIFFFLADKDKGDIRGYMLLPDAEKSGFHVREMWNVNIPHSQQTISNIGNYIESLTVVSTTANSKVLLKS